MADAGFGDPVALGMDLLRGGVQVLQVRCKGWPESRVRQALIALAPACQQAGVPLIVNDHPALADLADGVHLGQQDGPFDRTKLGPAKLVGRSTHDREQLAAAVAEGVDYVGFGPVFATGTKPDALPPRGLVTLAEIVRASPVPVVAIGGICPENLGLLRQTGVHAWAIISAILATPDPVAAARSLSA
jgi:thiamine-phosphate pyrophosphorylase